jgi:hypothetical protein
MEKKLVTHKPNYLPQVVLISDEFEISQLNKTRKIWALPHDYDNSSEFLMYLQDAQNLLTKKQNTKLGNRQKLAVMSEYKIGKLL